MGSQAIHLAAASGNRYFIELLLAKFGADISKKTKGKQSVVHCAA
jgi:hypothetical protein